MKTLSFTFFIILLTFSSVYPATVTNINAVYRNGQVFVTWDNVAADLFILYKSTSPILRGNQLPSAQNLGKVNYTSSFNSSPGRYIRIDSASQPLTSTKGLFVSTTTANGNYYYAVTTITNNIEDTSIVTGANSLTSPVNESVGNPRPVWQFDTLIAPKLFNVYAWFATKVTSTNFPKMTNVGTYPRNFAIVKKGTQSPHPVTYWLRPGVYPFIHEYVYGTGDPNEWIISIDDYTPISDRASMYYGYHENFNFFGNNSIPDTGTIINYTSAMINHTVEWVSWNLPIDSTRIYMTGASRGAMGTILNSFMTPSHIAAVLLIVPQVNVATFYDYNIGLIWGTYETNLFTNEGLRRNERLNGNNLLSINRLNSMPVIYTFCGKIDEQLPWYEKIAFYDSINVLKHGGFHFWSMTDHLGTVFSNPWKIAAWPFSFPYFTRYRTNLSYPAFSNCSHNNDPGNGSPASGDSIGQINGHLEWNDDIVDSLYKWEITLKTKDLVTIYDTLYAPDSCDADVTLRRLQRFNPAIGNTIMWTNTKNNVVVQQGSFTYSGGLITIPDFQFYKSSSRLKLVNIPIGITGNGNTVPLRYELNQNYPNPFNPQTKIEFDLPKQSFVKLVIYDVLGREVAMLVNEELKPGTYKVDWDASNYSSGVYFYKLLSGAFIETKKMILLK